MEFRKIDINDKVIIEKYIPKTDYLGWEFNFPMIWIWDVFDTTKICDCGDMALVYTTFFDKPVFFPPFINNVNKTPEALEKIQNYCKNNNFPLDVRGLTKQQAETLDIDKFQIISDRDNFDYIYSSLDLRELVGKKFHSKRNYLSRFTSKYSYITREYTEHDYEGLMQIYNNWYVKSVHDTLDLEGKAIMRALKYYKELNLKILLIEIKDKIVAFSISSSCNFKVGHTYFEKGDISFDGIYQAINNFTAKKYFVDCEFINREEDMGIEGLRKAKESYNPVILLEKFNILAKK